MKKKLPWRRWLLISVLVGTGLALLGVICVASILWYYGRQLPDFQSLSDYRPPQVSRMYDRQGRPVAEFFEERRTVVPFTEVPVILRQAFLAAEDADFYRHPGLDFPGMLRALWSNLLAGRVVQGGSTITQQVIKTMVLGPERSLERKVKEVLLALRLERNLSKDDILSLYLNQIYFGQGNYGIQEASRFFFAKDVSALNLAEAATLASLPKSPALYSPLRHPERARARRNWVLEQMVKNGFVEPDAARAAQAEPLQATGQSLDQDPPAPYYTEYCRRELEKLLGSQSLLRDGWRIELALDLDLQIAAQKALLDGLGEVDKRRGAEEVKTQGALVAIDPASRYVLALVGGRDFRESSFIRAVQAHRQPGSAFKPVLYAAAVHTGSYTPATIMVDSPEVYHMAIRGHSWKPQNFERDFQGEVPLRVALAHSMNTVAVKLAADIGPATVVEMARCLGIDSEIQPTLSVALGASEVTPLELTNAYAVFASGGMWAEPVFMTRLVRPDGSELALKQGQPPRQALSPAEAFIMTWLLQAVVQEGTATRARALGRPLAGKTGTTNGHRDAWFVGFSAELVAGVWVGLDDHGRMGGSWAQGAGVALPIWMDFMKQALRDRPPQNFAPPREVVFVRVDPRTGLLASPGDGQARMEAFVSGTEPSKTGDLGSGRALLPPDSNTSDGSRIPEGVFR